MKKIDNYYISSFFWSTSAKVVAAVLGFITVPLLISLWGRPTYGIMSLAAACNSYVQLLDLGMNTGAVKFFSQWKEEGKTDLVYRVAHSNTVFYCMVAMLNILIIGAIALWGESFFNITHEQFMILRLCLYIIMIFSLPTWVTTSYSQLLVANMEIAFTQKWNLVMYIVRTVLIIITIKLKLSLPAYYFIFLFITALLVIPYIIRCLNKKYIDSLKIRFYWEDFKVILFYSLAIFALSVFQSTAAQSRPIVLGMFAKDAANVVADYRVVEVIPSFIITVGGALSAIFLPKTAGLVASGEKKEVDNFAYKGTLATSVLTNVLCFPFILSANEILTAYVGREYAYLSKWLVVWCITVLIQIHTTPGNAIVLAYGKTKVLVIATAISCLGSIVINAILSMILGVGSAVVGYFIYVVCIIGSYYLYHYKYLLKLSRKKMLCSFLKPTCIAVCCASPFIFGLFKNIHVFVINERMTNILIFCIKSACWLLFYFIVLLIFRIIKFEKGKIIINY